MTAPPSLTPRPRVWPLYRAMVGIGALCGLSVVTTFELTRPIIARRQAAALERAVLDVLPDAIFSRVFRLVPPGIFEPTDEVRAADLVVYAGYASDHRLVGVAVEAQGMGYQDRVRLLYGYALDAQAIIGLRILESRETPGLGSRVETDRGFLANFRTLDVSVNADGSHVANPIAFVPPGEKTQPWEVDGISGATVTSRAVATMLRESTVAWIPRIYRRRTDFRQEG